MNVVNDFARSLLIIIPIFITNNVQYFIWIILVNVLSKDGCLKIAYKFMNETLTQ